MESNLSPRVKDVLSFSKIEADRLGNNTVATEHLFLGILREGKGAAITVLNSLGIDLFEFKKYLDNKLEDNQLELFEEDDIPLQESAKRILTLMYLEARALRSQMINTTHLLLAILKDETCMVTDYLKERDVDYHSVQAIIIKDAPKFQTDFSSKKNDETEDDNDDDDEENDETEGDVEAFPKESNTPVLDSFGIDITQAAKAGTLDPIVKREVEIERLAQILSRRKKNNPILIGEPGVGKSAIVEGLALRIVQRRVSRVLFHKRVISLDLASIVAGTKYRGQFEERMKAILNELAKTDNIILFIDEIHTIVGAGGTTGSLDAANILKPSLARGEIQCIGATTLDEYRQNIEKDGALERRFQKILVEPTSVEETILILNNIKEKYEDHHHVYYTPDAIEACVKLTTRYISDRHLPDKAIDALDEAGSRVRISNIHVPKTIIKLEEDIEKVHQDKLISVKSQNFELAASFRDKEKHLIEKLEKEKEKWKIDLNSKKEKVSEEHIAEVVAMMTGVPVKRIAQAEGSRLLQMNTELEKKVIGQNDAITKIVKAIQRNRAGLKDPNKPIGSFIFLGPTGVGKTQLAKVLSEYLFDSSEALIRIDMSEYMEKFAVSRLIGAPPGYVGYEDGGQLTEKVRRKPYSVILLDEIEKAHPDVFNILLQLLDDGQLTDSLGRKIDFKNCIVIMTSNIGSRELNDFGKGIGFQSKNSKDKDHTDSIIQKALRKAFAPEFINRIDDLIMFNSLSEADIHKIIDIELKGLCHRVEELGYKVKISSTTKKFIATKGYDAQYGARPLKRAIQKYLEDEMAEVIIKASLSEGDTISITLNKAKDKIITKILKKKNNEKSLPQTK